MLENINTNKFGEKKATHVIRYRVDQIYEKFFKNELVETQAQLLKGLITYKKLKEATKLLDIKKLTNEKKMNKNVIENIASAIKSMGKSRKKDICDAHKALTTTIVSNTTVTNCLTTQLEKSLGTS